MSSDDQKTATFSTDVSVKPHPNVNYVISPHTQTQTQTASRHKHFLTIPSDHSISSFLIKLYQHCHRKPYNFVKKQKSLTGGDDGIRANKKAERVRRLHTEVDQRDRTIFHFFQNFKVKTCFGAVLTSDFRCFQYFS